MRAQALARRVRRGLVARMRRSDPDDPLLRQVLPLGRELEFLTLYLEIERTRFPDRLAIAIDADEKLRPALVPHFVLQPLVENAVRYGVGRRDGPGRIEITARRDEDRLGLACREDAPGQLLDPPGEREHRARIGRHQPAPHGPPARADLPG